MATKLGVYNLALSILKITKLDALTDNEPHRHHLDQHWDTTVRYMLEEGLWNFAQRTSKIDSDPSLSIEFGKYSYGAEKPSDLVKLITISSDENLSERLDDYLEEGDHWFVKHDPIYVRYISNSTSFGLDLTRWPAKFETAVALQLALRSAPGLGAFSDADIERFEKKYTSALHKARSFDASSQMNTEWSPGRMVRSRGSGAYGSGRNSLWWDS